MTENEDMPRYNKLKNNQTEEPWGKENCRNKGSEKVC